MEGISAGGKISRRPFQGVTNIIRFNWHFYALAAAFFCALTIAKQFVPDAAGTIISVSILLMLAGTLLSLMVSYYVYDRSNLYTLDWLNINPASGDHWVNINAGFDETSDLLVKQYPHIRLSVFDFYDPAKHTEVSIERARRAYPAYPGTQTISTDQVPLQPHSIDRVFAILAAHEIRDHKERVLFFRSLKSSMKDGGELIVVEHLRNLPNFIAYNIGFLHFFSRREWISTFDEACLAIKKEDSITPFIHVFILR